MRLAGWATQRYSAGFLSLRLRHAMGQQDDESEALASAYVEGSRSDTPSFSSSDPSAASQDKSVRPSPSAPPHSPQALLCLAPKNTKLTLPPFLAAWQMQARQLEEFVRDFKAARKVFHKRALWSERWNRGEVSWQED